MFTDPEDVLHLMAAYSRHRRNQAAFSEKAKLCGKAQRDAEDAQLAGTLARMWTEASLKSDWHRVAADAIAVKLKASRTDS